MGRLPAFAAFLLLTLLSCGQRYSMNNMMGEPVDVTGYIRSGAYRPDSCAGRLDRLVHTGIPRRDAGFNARLVAAYRSFRNGPDPAAAGLPLHAGNIGRRTQYLYTYFIAGDPIDVYRSGVDTGNGPPVPLYIRLDGKQELVAGYARSHWVQNACDLQ
ncbi:MAG: hypothetical protein EOO11_02370 [Chitinophagaceae bacterium]|nr:MAG: hypothetical protein EOO11_02370 [Chitinophagaceae bacterium]